MTITKMVAAATAIDKANTGYDQSQRWSFFDRKTKKIKANGEGDCSSVCGAIAVLGGYDVDLSDPFYTGTFKDRLVKAGFKAIKYTKLSDLRVGDFVLSLKGHVEFVPAEGMMFSANIDENGRASGGKAGDQTRREVFFKKAYSYSKGWDWILRPPVESSSGGSSSKTVAVLAQEVIDGKWGNGEARVSALTKAGYDAKAVQAAVNKKLKSGPSSSGSSSSVLKLGMTDKRVGNLQRGLRRVFPSYKHTVKVRRGVLISVDDYFGAQTKAWVREFQRRTGLLEDGVVGAKTIAKLARYGIEL